MISEKELPSFQFRDSDAIFLTDGVQLEFLISNANESLKRASLIPLSTNAYEAVLKAGHRRIRSYFNALNFQQCLTWYTSKGLTLARTWLKELGLHFHVEGIDVAELDAPCQFLLFTLSAHIEETAERMIGIDATTERFYVITSKQPLPLDFYFDSDVPAAIIRFVCERLGRQVQAVVMEKRHDFLHSGFEQRPITNRNGPPNIIPLVPESSRRRVGFVPATVGNRLQIQEALRDLDCDIVSFSSAWLPLMAPGGSRGRSCEFEFTLSGADDQWTPAMASQLSSLRIKIAEHLQRSTLPASIIRNPHLEFQIDYIITRRWLSYANMIRRAARFVSQTRLDLLILSDHFTAEGAILARLYRRRRTGILISLHSAWPVDRNWAAWEPSDRAIVLYRTAAARLRELSGMSEIHVTGTPIIRKYRSLVRASTLARSRDRIKSILAARKMVVLVTNSLELNCVPFIDLSLHFETLKALARIPSSLQHRVALAVRTKPKPAGEDTVLYSELGGFSPESLTILNGLDFSEAVSAADCIVGVNLPTGGYFEILERGIPLLHVQTAASLVLHPDLPSNIVHVVRNNSAIWPAIESVLFDDRTRQQLLNTQRQFIAADAVTIPEETGSPVQRVLRELLGSKPGFRWRNAFRRSRSVPVDPIGKRELPSAVPNEFIRSHQGGAGNIDDVLVGFGGLAMIIGWAADMTVRRPARAVHIFLDGKWLGKSGCEQSRPDVAAALNEENLTFCGFSARVPFGDEAQASTLTIYSELDNGTFFELPNPVAGLLPTEGTPAISDRL
jgi:hypothetical protein